MTKPITVVWVAYKWQEDNSEPEVFIARTEAGARRLALNDMNDISMCEKKFKNFEEGQEYLKNNDRAYCTYYKIYKQFIME